jgi:hypothetical protein
MTPQDQRDDAADQDRNARPPMTQDVYMDRKMINPQTAAALDATLGKP